MIIGLPDSNTTQSGTTVCFTFLKPRDVFFRQVPATPVAHSSRHKVFHQSRRCEICSGGIGSIDRECDLVCGETVS
jgi:hypothetical protein